MSSHRLSTFGRQSEVDRALGRFRNKMGVPCSRCYDADQSCFVDVRTRRCKKCVNDKKKCDIRVTLRDFEQLVRSREKLSRRLESAEDELENAEADAVASHQEVVAARAKARSARRLLRASEGKEDNAY